MLHIPSRVLHVPPHTCCICPSRTLHSLPDARCILSRTHIACSPSRMLHFLPHAHCIVSFTRVCVFSFTHVCCCSFTHVCFSSTRLFVFIFHACLICFLPSVVRVCFLVDVLCAILEYGIHWLSPCDDPLVFFFKNLMAPRDLRQDMWCHVAVLMSFVIAF